MNYEMIYEIANNSPEEDVILTYNQPWADNIEEKLGASTKIKIIKLNLFGSAEPQKEITILSKVLGREAESKHYIDWYDSLFFVVQNRVRDIPEEKRMKVYWDAPSLGHYDTAGEGSPADMIISRAGGILISKKQVSSSVSASPEWIMQENPDVILSHPSSSRHLANVKFDYSSTAVDMVAILDAWNELTSSPGINATNAVRDKRVYFINDLMFGPSQPVGAVVLAKLFYPEKFEDINVQKLLKYYYEHFMKLEYKGFYLYPAFFEINI